MRIVPLPLIAGLALVIGSCTQEQQNQISRSIQNWTGTNGVLDTNQNYKQDEGEKKIYFEVSDYGTNYVFYENPGR
jgi:hypothetical protein